MWWGKEIILGFEAGNRHMEAAGGVLCCIPSPGWISNIAPFPILKVQLVRNGVASRGPRMRSGAET